jgi:hypothetical protein
MDIPCIVSFIFLCYVFNLGCPKTGAALVMIKERKAYTNDQLYDMLQGSID